MTGPAQGDPDSSAEGRRAEAASDRSLILRVRMGQSDAPTQLYLRYAERLHALASKQSSPELARRVEPEDIVQSVFRTFFRRVAEGQYDVPEGEEIWKLLLVIALNKVRAAAIHHRAAKRDVRQTAGGEAIEDAVGPGSGQGEVALTVLRLTIEEAMAGLPESHRRMIELRVEGHEIAEIAAAVGRSKRSVERVLQDFRKRLDGLIREEG
jgi:RNA polymerase sigma-70 factor (ECF subfamily)